ATRRSGPGLWTRQCPEFLPENEPYRVRIVSVSPDLLGQGAAPRRRGPPAAGVVLGFTDGSTLAPAARLAGGPGGVRLGVLNDRLARDGRIGMEILGIGTDIVECPRIGKMIEQHGELFLRRVYTEREIRYCQSRKHAIEHFAGRWAAKEAILKAIGTGWAR